MPRRPRLFLPEIPAHLIQRGNNRQPVFFAPQDHHCYLGWLGDYALIHRCTVHAWVLMTNHVHLLVTGEDETSIPGLMKNLGQRYTQYINRHYERTGGLWEGRYKACLTQSEDYVLSCMRYIELNPVRAGMVAHPADYPWSSYRIHAQGAPNPVGQAHRAWFDLGSDTATRCNAYRALFHDTLPLDLINQIRDATNANLVLGNARFAEQIERALGVRARKGQAGRPRKPTHEHTERGFQMELKPHDTRA